jgi:hypothetical protein
LKIDLTLVAGRRPKLLVQTLRSFQARVLRHLEIGTVYANIDPFCGTPADGDACADMIRAAFPSAVLTRPETPSFGAAVQRLWLQPQSNVVFHMEDDWLMTEDLRPERIAPELQGNVVQVQLSSLARVKSPHPYNYPARWRTVLGIKLGKVYDLTRPLFATSPSFLTRDFMQGCAALMDPDLDPEKQLYSGDTALSRFTLPFRSRVLPAMDGGPLVVDLGRDWLRARNIRKDITDGVSHWEPVAKP